MGEEVPSHLSEKLAHAHEMERAGEKAWKKTFHKQERTLSKMDRLTGLTTIERFYKRTQDSVVDMPRRQGVGMFLVPGILGFLTWIRTDPCCASPLVSLFHTVHSAVS